MTDLRGRWRNGLGEVLRVSHLFTGGPGGYLVLGNIWVALPEGVSFGRAAWLVTEDGLKTGGYERIGDKDE